MEYPVNYDSPTELRDFLQSGSLSMKKRFGQNFLINCGAREKIVSVLPIEPGCTIWEIGPGLGAMTWHLLEKNADVTVFEIDHGFIGALNTFYGELTNFRLIEGDFIKNFRRMSVEGIRPPDFILGNLPYVSGSVMIAEIVKSVVSPKRMVFTLQKEVGQRMAACPGSRDYSSFSLVCQSKYDISLRGELKPGSFYPKPAVNSVIVEMQPHMHFNPGKPEVYYQLIDDLFLARRKKITNNISGGRIASLYGEAAVADALDKSKIDKDCRAETLSVAELELLSRLISENSK